MRHVFSNSMCAHVWAQQTQDWGKSDSMRFEGEVMWSYSTPVARILTVQPDGKGTSGFRVLLFTDERHSPTTGRHMSECARAFGWSNPMFHVPTIGASGGRHHEGYSKAVDHAANLSWLVEVYRRAVLRVKRCREMHGRTVREVLEHPATTVIEYARIFNMPLALDWEREADEVQAFRDAREARLNTPEMAAKRERARVKRGKREGFKRMHAEALVMDRERTERIEAPFRVARWRAGEDVRLGWNQQQTEDGSALLRRKPGDGSDVLQTSQGAEVPMEHARRAFERLSQWRAGGLDTPRTFPINVGHFRITESTAWGIVAGCHRISWSEIQAFAAAQGWEVQS